jgi:hypothetical protein
VASEILHLVNTLQLEVDYYEQHAKSFYLFSTEQSDPIMQSEFQETARRYQELADIRKTELSYYKKKLKKGRFLRWLGIKK